MRWRLGIDLGTNSLGWIALELDADGNTLRILDGGVRIFSDGRDPKSGASLATDRRAARSMRRRLDRFAQRRDALLKHLTLAGLFPADDHARKELAALDPFELRARALHEKLPPHHLGRALFHLNQRRGFKSNRKTDRAAENESGKIKVGVGRLYEAMAEAAAPTLGAFLLDEGFEMSQFSIYARFCSGKEQFEAHMRRIERSLPDRGEVHVLTFTDRQYENIVRFSGQRRRRPRKNPDQLALF